MTGFRRATGADRPRIEALLRARIEAAMFPLSNLLDHGLAGEAPGGPPLAMRFWLAQGEAPALLGTSAGGMIFPLLPPGLAPQAARALAGRPVAGIIGAAAEAAALRTALGLDRAPGATEGTEPHFRLPLDRLRVPEGDTRLAALAAAPREVLVAWRAAYGREVLGWEASEAPARAAPQVEAALAGDRHRVLLRGSEPVAMTGFNAVADEAVQVGWVWTPPPLRGQGLARRAVALHLAEARSAGARLGVLCAASAPAARAYRAIGFEPIGRFALLVFRSPQRAPGVAAPRHA